MRTRHGAYAARFGCGDVVRRPDSRHEGRVDAIISGRVKVVWENGWIEYFESCDELELVCAYGTKVKKIIAPEPVTLYWAYGSNLNMDAMEQRCPAATPFKALYVNNGRLVFRGVADVEGVKDANQRVAGGVWKVTPACIAAMDRYEGVASGLYEKQYLLLGVKNESGKMEKKKCLFYKMNSEGVMPPWESYLASIEQGYKDFGLDLKYLYEAVHRSQGEDRNKTPDLERSWIAKGKPVLAKKIRRVK